MERKSANPAPLGLTGFALTTWMLSMVNAGWFSGDAVPLVLASAFAFGGTAQFAAGLMEMPRGNTFGFVAFCSFGAFWWTFALFVQFFAAKVPVDFVGWWLVMWGVFTFYMWIGSLALNRGVQSIFLSLWITFFLLGVGRMDRDCRCCTMPAAIRGWSLRWWPSTWRPPTIINETHGRTVLPLGAPAAPAGRHVHKPA